MVDALRAVLAAGPDQPVPAPSATWALVLQAVQRHRVVGIVAPHAAVLGCPPDVAARLHELHLHEVGRAMVLVHETARASAALAVAGIDHLVVKGVGLAAVMGGRPVDRGGGDIDLWVRPSDVAAAEVALAQAESGWVRPASSRAPLPADTRRWAWMLREEHEMPLVPAGPGPAAVAPGAQRRPVDLHWRLFEHEGEFSFGFEGALAGSIAVAEVGPTVRTLGAAHALEHVAQHARKEAWLALRQVADVLRVARVCGPEVAGPLAARSRHVRLAMAMAARLAPGLEAWAGPRGAADRRLVDEGWRGCLGFGSYAARQYDERGWPLVAARWGHFSWVVRSAPGWGARWRHVTRLVGRSRVLVDPRHHFWRGRA